MTVDQPITMAERFPDEGHDPTCTWGVIGLDHPPRCQCGAWGKAMREMEVQPSEPGR